MTPRRPFRFGVLCTTGTGVASKWKELSRRVEDLGFSTLLVPDHLKGPQLAPVPALAVAAEVTARVRLGCHVFNNDLRHPAVLARDLATLDQVSDGRLEVGLGAGWQRDDYALRGTQPDDARIRIDRLNEAVAALKVLLAGETVTAAGRYYAFSGYRLSPAPVQRPRPPLMIGGGGRAVLELAAREADIVGVNLSLRGGSVRESLRTTTTEVTARKIGWVRGAAGDRLGSVELSIFVYVTEVGSRSEEVARSRAGEFGMSPEELMASPHVLVGSLDEVVEKLERQRAELGISYVCIDDTGAETFAAVVERLSGR